MDLYSVVQTIYSATHGHHADDLVDDVHKIAKGSENDLKVITTEILEKLRRFSGKVSANSTQLLMNAVTTLENFVLRYCKVDTVK